MVDVKNRVLEPLALLLKLNIFCICAMSNLCITYSLYLLAILLHFYLNLKGTVKNNIVSSQVSSSVA